MSPREDSPSQGGKGDKTRLTVDALGRPRINFLSLTLRNPTKNEETPAEEYGRKKKGGAGPESRRKAKKANPQV